MGNERWSWDWHSQWRGLDYLNFDIVRLSVMNHASDEDFIGSRGFTLTVLGFRLSVVRYGA